MSQPLLLLTLDFPPAVGGIQSMLHNTCLHLQGWQPVVLAPDQGGAAAHDHQPYRIRRSRSRFPRKAGHLPAQLRLGWQEVRRSRPKLIVAGHVLSVLAARPLAKLAGVPLVVITYGAELRAGWSARLAPLLLPSADGVVAISEATKEQAVRAGARPERVFVTPVGVSAQHLQPCTTVLPDAWQLTGAQIVLAASRLDDQRKGHDVLLDALPRVFEQAPSTICVIVGEGRLRRTLQAKAQALGLTHRCRFVGAVSDGQLAALYERADVFVLPSRTGSDGGFEGFGIVYAEANAHGTPVVAGNEGGVSAAVQDGVTGLQVNPRDPQAVADAVLRLLADRPFAAKLGEAGRQRVEHELTWPAVGARLSRYFGCVAGVVAA